MGALLWLLIVFIPGSIRCALFVSRRSRHEASSFCATATLVASIGFATAAAAQTKWDFATAYAPFNFHSKNNEQFVKDVDAATAGKLKITPHFGASLFKMPEIKRAVQTGNAQMGEFFLVSFKTNRRSLASTDCRFW